MRVNPNFASIHSYADALKAWESGRRFPKSIDTDPRGLVDRRKRHMVVHKKGDDIQLYLYNTPLVTWHKDNSFTIVPHDSVSSRGFIHRCTPWDVYATVYDGYFVIKCGERIYKITDRTTFKLNEDRWEPDHSEPWAVTYVNKTKANQALKEANYKEFRLWMLAYVQMSQWEAIDRPYIFDSQILQMLKDKSQWRDILRCRHVDAWSDSNYVLARIRKLIYKTSGCIETVQVSYLQRG